jgi:hypothetical protein
MRRESYPTPTDTANLTMILLDYSEMLQPNGGQLVHA